ALHIAAIGALWTSVLMLDLRLLGAFRSMPEKAFAFLFRRIALAAFAAAVLTGIALFSVKASDYAAMPAFLLKLGLIAAALVNFVGFAALERRPGEETLRPALRLSAMASIVLWSAVLLAGRF